ncbi:glycoside hydrolase family 9 protein [Paenibacillus guangzhouensis]|uniref:glycoside hydrolase family 9 protein n=1 Tax=Paenibacillus guangzhouensis TaxID=1473112 RepID=UPI001266A864|nr:glycoside hydrolase family 9 protein [Paenibacillus guangzhouensis]
MRKRFPKILLSLSLTFGAISSLAPLTMKASEAQWVGMTVKVDQIGYLLHADKVAFVTDTTATDQFHLISLDSNKKVFSGKLSAAISDANSGDNVRTADFSSFKEPGTYVLQIEGGGVSYPFRIGDDVYRSSMIQAIRSYTLGRSGIAIRDGLTGLAHEAGHTQDKQAMMFFADEFHKKGDTVDVSGGWYDAGDYGKYIPTATVSTAQLLLAYEFAPSKFYKGQLMLPEGTSNNSKLPDILAETKFELEWMKKMQRGDGAVYFKVAGMRWPGFVKPELDTQDRYVYGLTTYGTAQFAGVMAMAARIYEPFDTAYAKELLGYAQKAQQYLEKHPSPEFRLDKDQDSGSGGYGKTGDIEERIWAAAELLKTTGKKEYDLYIKERFANQIAQKSGHISWADSILLGQYAYVTSKQADISLKEKVKAAIVANADSEVEKISKDGYRVALSSDQYGWGSAKDSVAHGNVLLMANALSPKEAYVKGALDQLHYLFGRNATGYSYMTGSGTRMPLYPHNRMIAGTHTYIPGLVVGGPNKYGGDPAIDKIIKDAGEGSVPPAKAYIDITDSYSTNEHAIDYIAPVAFALAYFSKGDIEEAPKTTDGGNQIVNIPKGSLDKNYIGAFGTLEPFHDPSSMITHTLSSDGSLKVEYNLHQGGWLGTSADVGENWIDFSGIALDVKGGTGVSIRVELTDGNGVHYEKMIVDDAKEGKKVKLPFHEFTQRKDYQPDGMDTRKPFSLNPVRSLTISPLSGEGTITFSNLKLWNK